MPRITLALLVLFALLAGVGAQEPTPAEIDKKLKALEAARQAGILSPAEFEAKRKELLAGRLDEATRKKLAALDAARKAGILTPAEYAAKRAEILEKVGRKAGSGKPDTPKKKAGPVRTEPAWTPYRDGRKRFWCAHPEAWRTQVDPMGRGVKFTGGGSSITVHVVEGAPGVEPILDQLESRVRAAWGDRKVHAPRPGRIGPHKVSIRDFSGVQPQGGQARAWLTGCQQGSLAIVLIFTCPPDRFAALAPVWERWLGTFSFTPPAAGAKAPGAGAKPPQGGAAPKPPQSAGREGRIYSHPVGFRFWYPRDWKVVPRADTLMLVPPGASAADRNPREVYYLAGDSVEGMGITSPADPRVAAFLDNQVRSQLPFLRLGGGSTPIKMARGLGALYTWAGANPRGERIVGRAYACLLKGQGIALMAIGYPQDVEKRKKTLRRIFASFGFGEGRRDPALAGRWTLYDEAFLSGPKWVKWDRRAAAYRRETCTMALAPDGTVVQTTVWELYAQGAGTSIHSGPRKETARGRWSAADGTLFILWKDRTWSEFRYTLAKGAKGPELHLQAEKVRQKWHR